MVNGENLPLPFTIHHSLFTVLMRFWLNLLYYSNAIKGNGLSCVRHQTRERSAIVYCAPFSFTLFYPRLVMRSIIYRLLFAAAFALSIFAVSQPSALSQQKQPRSKLLRSPHLHSSRRSDAHCTAAGAGLLGGASLLLRATRRWKVQERQRTMAPAPEAAGAHREELRLAVDRRA